jgi:Protein of unknown function (DUF1189)
MKKFGLLRGIVMSFYSADLYRDVGRNWTGTGLLYLTVLLAICWVPTAVRTHFGLHRFAVTEVPKMTAELPAISIKNGVMESRPPGRHVFRDDSPRPGRPPDAFIIDDTIDEVPSDLPPGTTMLTRREVGGTRTNGAERRVLKLAALGDWDLTPERVRRFLSSLQFWVPPLALGVCLIGSLIFRFVQGCVYASLTRMFARGKQVTLDFTAALRISAVAVTPVIVLRTLIWFFPGEPYWYFRWPIAIIITILYLRFAVAALADVPADVPASIVV